MRTSPQSSAIQKLTCEKCSFGAKTDVDLKKHMENHILHAAQFNCNKCKKEFARQVELERHHKREHKRSAHLNCDDCDFQAHEET